MPTLFRRLYHDAATAGTRGVTRAGARIGDALLHVRRPNDVLAKLRVARGRNLAGISRVAVRVQASELISQSLVSLGSVDGLSPAEQPSTRRTLPTSRYVTKYFSISARSVGSHCGVYRDGRSRLPRRLEEGTSGRARLLRYSLRASTLLIVSSPGGTGTDFTHSTNFGTTASTIARNAAPASRWAGRAA